MSDLIYRQAAIDAFGLSEKTRKYGGDHSGYDTMMLYEIQDVLESLPSADAIATFRTGQTYGKSTSIRELVEVVRCKDCKYMTEHYDTDGNAPYWTCSIWDSETDYDGFCHYAERRTDD